MQAQPISEPCKGACTISSGATWKHTVTTSSSNLGLIVSYLVIEVNPKKLKDVFRMNSSTKLKDVQKLTGCMAALNRFVSRLGERAMPFYKLLKKQDKFQ